MIASLYRWLCAAVLAAVTTLSPVAIAAPSFPPLTGRVVDEANILAPDTETALAARLEEFEAATSRQLIIVTVASLQGYEIEDYGYQLGRLWGIGDARKDDGVLLLVAPNERRVRIEVGYGLEPLLTDAFSDAILQNIMLPRLRDGNFNEAVIAGVNAIVGHLSLPEADAKAGMRDVATGEARTDAFSVFVSGLLSLWLVWGLVSLVRGRGAGAWLWPLFFLMRHGGHDRGDTFRGRGGSFGGGGASGRW